DRLMGLRRGRGDVGLVDHHVAALVVLEGLDDLLPRHFLPGVRVDALEADRLAVARVQHAERQVVAARARHQRDGHVEQSEAEVAGPDRSGHAVARRSSRTASLPPTGWWPCASAIAAPMPDPGSPARATCAWGRSRRAAAPGR